ncbi:glycosyltransferase [Alloalcanivorax xenomutans]|uniref:glycosyltransferase n=1 Tax=Alloalcanivorax xenomutans TaxID=1094342 RepID=UPI0024E2415E|nr:glycosyltransferase [Alloalcanivorax xenomutans]WOD30076.1 glycosyltransferase [Alloalcanivorax xenomutans]
MITDRVMHIALVSTTLDYAGAELQVVQLAKRMREKGHVVTVISLKSPVASLVYELESFGVKVRSLGLDKVIMLPLALHKMLRAIEDDGYDIVHAHMVHANIFSRIARILKPSFPLICTIHSTNEGGFFRDFLYRVTRPLSSLDTGVSKAVKDRFLSVKAVSDECRVVYNGINLSHFSIDSASRESTKRTEFTWLAIGRFHWQKDYSNLINAFALLNSVRSDWRLLIVGYGEEETVIRNLIEQKGLVESIHLVGKQQDVRPWYAKADAFVSSSVEEGYGLVVAEALACQLPVVATESGGPSEILGRDGSVGILVPVQDAQALSSALTELMAIPKDERMVMGQKGRKKVLAEFSLDEIVSQWLDIYQSVLPKKAC